jgi:glycosyltransferase involved in cell wall biosynthesis
LKSLPLKILILSSYDVGGASIAAIRLHLALLKAGVLSRLMTLHKSNGDIPEHYQYKPQNGWKRKIELKIRQRTEHQQKNSLNLPKGQSLSGEFSMPLASYDVTDSPHWKWADAVNIHWVNEWISLENLVAKSNQKPMIWTMHDMHAFTGGCHYSHHCMGFEIECKNCPMLVHSSIPQLAHHFWKSKKTALYIHQPKLRIVAPSQWMVDLASKSSLFSEFTGTRIFNSLDTSVFKPLPQEMCVSVLGLPKNKKIMLAVSQSLKDRRKGFSILIEALKRVPDPENWVLCTVGKLHDETSVIGVEHIHLGSIHDERLMAIIYNSASMFVHPATEDNLPNVVVEALCCGLPVAGFQIGGMPEMIIQNQNGNLTSTISPEGLLFAILEALPMQALKMQIAEAAHQTFSGTEQANQFLQVVKQVVA